MTLSPKEREVQKDRLAEQTSAAQELVKLSVKQQELIFTFCGQYPDDWLKKNGPFLPVPAA